MAHFGVFIFAVQKWDVMLTGEQMAIIDSTGDIKINAVAGSGKTTTLIEYAKARPGQKILYLAFNRAVKLDAERKFAEKGVSNVRIETAHSVAFSRVVRGTGYIVRPEGYKAPEVVGILGLGGLAGRHTEYVLATHINAFVSWFCNSDKAKVQQLNYEEVVTGPGAREFVIRFKAEIAHQTRVFLDKMNRGEIPITHDFYLKKFQLGKPALPFDVILFDEGQDASAAMLDIFLSQKAVKVIVGDSHQQIYGWRYAVNSLEKVDYPLFDLSASFRFDQDIAQLARQAVSWKRHLEAPSAIGITGAGKRDRIRDRMIGNMKNMHELEEYIENTGDAQLRMLVEVVKEYGKKIPGYIKQLKGSHLDHDDKDKAYMIFSTVHRCKGMEYDEVTLADDFITEKKIRDMVEEGGETNPAKLSEEINLLYVAVTRAKSSLHVPGNIFPQLVEKRGGLGSDCYQSVSLCSWNTVDRSATPSSCRIRTMARNGAVLPARLEK